MTEKHVLAQVFKDLIFTTSAADIHVTTCEIQENLKDRKTKGAANRPPSKWDINKIWLKKIEFSTDWKKYILKTQYKCHNKLFLVIKQSLFYICVLL